ncbi:membrane hypothetical protein [Sulfurovum sp. enrichment culture clone C5]|uniref:Uncharacterized protein n=1 Tax=Sulfurovum sp. enrichment culture clone C5 TaxID=497650 RepID=A0A0S4XN75_9BACT|nr:membrane hypothetical protein [Sulfurovum sp. enrichment culture clone C5]
MKTGNIFYDTLPKIEQEKYKILFEDKSDWYIEDNNGNQNWNQSKEKINDFDDKLKKFIISQYNLSFLHFPPFDIKNYIFKKDREVIFCNSIFYGKTDFNSGFTKYIQETNFENATFREKVDFSQYTFGYKISFKSTTFNKDVDFKLSNFTKYINFRSTTFKKDVNFDEAIFENKVSFWGAIFHDKVHFDSTVFKETFNFTKTQINKITLVNTNVENANLLEISAYDETNPKDPKPLTKDNFENKESARLIKAHFEKQNNITEANKYFVIEQEKYIDELKDKDNKTEGGKLTKLFPLYLNKYVSNFGTDWLRSILILFLWGFVALFLYMTNRYSLFTFPNEFYMANEWNKSNIVTTVFIFIIFVLAYLLNLYFVEVQNYKRKAIIGYFRFLHKHIKIKSKLYKTLMIIKFCILSLVAICIFIFCLYDSNLFNLISKLINPINAFKDDETFKGYEAFGAMVRIISATIIYQIIVAFRQFTRRG